MSRRKQSYYDEEFLTVGMLEDYCKEIKDKTTIVELADRTGLLPQAAINALHVIRNRKAIGLTLLGDFSWEPQRFTDDDDEDWEGGGELEQEVTALGALAAMALRKQARTQQVTVAACEVFDADPPLPELPHGVEFLGDIDATTPKQPIPRSNESSQEAVV